MAKRLTLQEKRENFVYDAIYKQFEIANVDRSVLETDKEKWFQNNTMTMAQREEWKAWFIAEVKRIFRFNKKYAEREFAYFDLMWGLRLSDFPPVETQSDSSSK
jgi:hypothetical protein